MVWVENMIGNSQVFKSFYTTIWDLSQIKKKKKWKANKPA